MVTSLGQRLTDTKSDAVSAIAPFPFSRTPDSAFRGPGDSLPELFMAAGIWAVSASSRTQVLIASAPDGAGDVLN